MTEKVAFGDCSHIDSVFIENRNSCIAIAGEFFKPLADCVFFKKIGGGYFRDHDFCDIQFINFETDRGVFQLTVYNTHNGYYGHDIFIQVDDKIVFQKVLDNTKNSCIERSTPDENTIPKVLENNAKK